MTAMFSGFPHIMDYEESQIFLCVFSVACGTAE